MNTQEVAQKLLTSGLIYSSDEVAKLAKLNVFQGAKKDAQGVWQIPNDAVDGFIKQRKQRRFFRWLAGGSIIVLCGFLFAVISGTKDFLDFINTYIVPLSKNTPTQIATPTLSQINVQQMLLSASPDDYRLEVTIKNPFSYDALVKEISILADNYVSNEIIECTSIPSTTYKISDTLSIKDTGNNKLNFQGFITNETNEEYKYRLSGSLYDSGCVRKNINLKFDTSFILASGAFSSFSLLVPKNMQLIGSSEKIPTSIAYPEYNELTLEIHTDHENTIQAKMSLQDGKLIETTPSP